MKGKRYAWAVLEHDGTLRGFYFTKGETRADIEAKLIFLSEEVVRVPKFDLDPIDIESPSA